MQDPEPRRADLPPDPRRCPSCGNDLDHIGVGGDELLECPHCGLVMFDAGSR